jgi:hypothetical protein
MFDKIQEETQNCLLRTDFKKEQNNINKDIDPPNTDNHYDDSQLTKENLIKEGKNENTKEEEEEKNNNFIENNNKNYKDAKQFNTQANFYKNNFNNINSNNNKSNYYFDNNNSNKNVKLSLQVNQYDANTNNTTSNNDINYNKSLNSIKNSENKTQNENFSKFKFNSIYNNNQNKNNNNFSPNYFTTSSSNLKSAYIKNLSISTEKDFQYKKANLDPLSRRLALTRSNFEKTVNTDSDAIRNSRFDKNYIKNLKLFIKSKSYCNMDKIVETDNVNKKDYDGFESYNVPHLGKIKLAFEENEKEEEKKNQKKPMAILGEKIAKSCVGNKKITFDLSQAESKIKEVQEESEKLKKIMMMQTSPDFLRKSKLPEILSYVAQPKLKIRRGDLGGGKVKHMGERYNPFNFQAGRDCETNRTNKTGALFQH